jgi:hypothetical protein
MQLLIRYHHFYSIIFIIIKKFILFIKKINIVNVSSLYAYKYKRIINVSGRLCINANCNKM